MSTPPKTETLEARVKQLEQEKAALEQEVRALRLEQNISFARTTHKQSEQRKHAASNGDTTMNGPPSPSSAFTPFEKVAALTNPEIARYGRQLILPGFGIQGNLKALRRTA
jgi:adenylyltransferase/sulfurtransferase